MTAYKGNSRKIKDGLIQILQGITYGDPDPLTGVLQPAFVQVMDNTKDEFEGYPSVRVLPNVLTSATADNIDVDHTVSFAVIMHFPLSSPTNVESATYNQMYDLTDLIIDTTEHADYIGKLSTIDPTFTNWIMSVKQATWRVASGKTGAMLLCNVNVEVSYSKSVN
jgi:hypothetical protein